MRFSSSTLQGFAFGVAVGYVLCTAQRRTLGRDELRARLMREEGVEDKTPAAAEG